MVPPTAAWLLSARSVIIPREATKALFVAQKLHNSLVCILWPGTATLLPLTCKRDWEMKRQSSLVTSTCMSKQAKLTLYELKCF